MTSALPGGMLLGLLHLCPPRAPMTPL